MTVGKSSCVIIAAIGLLSCGSSEPQANAPQEQAQSKLEVLWKCTNDQAVRLQLDNEAQGNADAVETVARRAVQNCEQHVRPAVEEEYEIAAQSNDPAVKADIASRSRQAVLSELNLVLHDAALKQAVKAVQQTRETRK